MRIVTGSLVAVSLGAGTYAIRHALGAAHPLLDLKYLPAAVYRMRGLTFASEPQ